MIFLVLYFWVYFTIFSIFLQVRVEIDSAENVKKYRKASEFKLNTPEFRGILTEQVHLLEKIFVQHGYDLRIAGGAVRLG